MRQALFASHCSVSLVPNLAAHRGICREVNTNTNLALVFCFILFCFLNVCLLLVGGERERETSGGGAGGWDSDDPKWAFCCQHRCGARTDEM